MNVNALALARQFLFKTEFYRVRSVFITVHKIVKKNVLQVAGYAFEGIVTAQGMKCLLDSAHFKLFV